MSNATHLTKFSTLRCGETFRFDPEGPVWIKCRGGFRPGRGGELHACSPSQRVIRFYC